MDSVMVMSVGTLMVLIIAIGQYIWHQRKTKKILEELHLFKKEKEYYTEAIMVLSESYEVVFANQSAKVLFSLNEEYNRTMNNNSIQLKIDTSEPKDFFEVLKQESKRKEDTFNLQNVILIINGKMKKVNIYVDKSGWNEDKTITCVIDMQAVTFTEPKSIQKDGGIDFFTGLPSQFSALSDINTSVMGSQKGSEGFSLFLLGIDNFKDLQITMGLGFANQLTKKIANYFHNNKLEDLRAYRMDCDKFLLILDKNTDKSSVREIAKRLILDIKNFYKNDSTVRLTTSMGIVMYPDDGKNASKLIDHAYIALSQVQKESEANIGFFETEYKTIHKDDIKMNDEIRKGLKNHEFFLYYQPIFNLKNEKMIGAEALIRWKHPELGLITADKFLDIAKKNRTYC